LGLETISIRRGLDVLFSISAIQTKKAYHATAENAGLSPDVHCGWFDAHQKTLMGESGPLLYTDFSASLATNSNYPN
jgi:hypothetical protein